MVELPYDGQIRLIAPFLVPAAFKRLRDEVDWQQEEITLFGRVHAVPRLIAYYGDVAYRYAGVDHPPRPLPGLLDSLQRIAEEASAFTFNSVLCNFYRHGQDGMGFHRDNEPGIDTRCIASLSFGAARRFRLRHRESRETVTLDLADGSLLLMLDCQEAWEHTIPRTKRPVGGRINLTYRKIDPGASSR
jgi:alkylated DNA repair dioxygenase AlkB